MAKGITEKEKAEAAFLRLRECAAEKNKKLEPLKDKADEIFGLMQDPGQDMMLLNAAFDELVDEAGMIRLAYSVQNPWVLTYMQQAGPDRGGREKTVRYKEYRDLLPEKWFKERDVKKILKEKKEELLLWQMQSEGKKARPCGVRVKKRNYKTI